MEAERDAFSAILINLRRAIRPIAVAAFSPTSVIAGLVLFGLTPRSMATTTLPVDSRKTQSPAPR